MQLKKGELDRFLGKKNGVAFWKRLLAYIIDVFVINFIIVFPFRDKLSFNNTDLFNLSFNNIKLTLLIGFIVSILTILYWTILEYKIQQTIGKALMNLYVQSRTKKLSFTQILLRNITKISAPLLILDTIYMFKTKTLRFTEILSNTYVIEK